ncbi:hypothetical protein E2P81_ATG01873 [Venturia nashicola]|nr:hypothetical protein E2P81_ATG01873 [Venturia nashicola]
MHEQHDNSQNGGFAKGPNMTHHLQHAITIDSDTRHSVLRYHFDVRKRRKKPEHMEQSTSSGEQKARLKNCASDHLTCHRLQRFSRIATKVATQVIDAQLPYSFEQVPSARPESLTETT